MVNVQETGIESDLGQYSFLCLRVGFMSSRGVDHVPGSCLRVGFMSSCGVDHVFVSVPSLRVVSCLRVGSCMSSC